MAKIPKKEMKLEDVFPSGKHKGLTLEYVLNEDIDYVEFRVEQDDLLLDNEAFNKYQFLTKY